VLLYYITDRLQFPGAEGARRERLLATIAAAARAGLDYIQLRERDLTARDLEGLACETMQAVREANRSSSRPAVPATRLLINSRTDIALAASADGVHLRSVDLAPSEARAIWGRSVAAGVQNGNSRFLVAASCHTAAEVRLAEAHGADFAVFAPVFEKRGMPGASPGGLDVLRKACQEKLPVLALGGITLENARSCLEAGAAGIAGIRLFQQGNIETIVAELRP